MPIYRITLKSDLATSNEQDFIVRLPKLGIVKNGYIYVESFIAKNMNNVADVTTGAKMLWVSPGRNVSQLNICSTTFQSPDSYDSRTGKSSKVLKAVPISQEYLIGASNGYQVAAMDVCADFDDLTFGTPVRHFDFSNAIINVSIKNEDLTLIAQSRIRFFQVTFVVTTD